MEHNYDFAALNLSVLPSCFNQTPQYVLRNIFNFFVVSNEQFITDVQLLDEVDAKTSNLEIYHKFGDLPTVFQNCLFAVRVILNDGNQQPNAHQDHRYLFAFY